MDKVKGAAIGILIGLVIGFFFIPRVPDVKVVKEYSTKTVTKTITNDRYIDRVITQTVTTAGTILTTIHEVIHEKPVEVINEKIVEKVITKEVNYIGSVAVGIDPFNLSEVCAGIQYDIFKPVFVEMIVRTDITKNIQSGSVLVGMRF